MQVRGVRWVKYRLTLFPNFSFHPGTGLCSTAILLPILSCNFHPAGKRVAEAIKFHSPSSSDGSCNRILKSSIQRRVAVSSGFSHFDPMIDVSPVNLLRIVFSSTREKSSGYRSRRNSMTISRSSYVAGTAGGKTCKTHGPCVSRSEARSSCSGR